MSARRRRLARHDFPALLAAGKRVSSEHFSVVYTGNVSGYAVVVSKKVAKTAVRRHLLKRRIRAILEHTDVPNGCAIFARSGADTLSFGALETELQTLLARIV
ncbi:MAG TPA: ribonuclease P protein component [Candidatus Paceibacterota bacterium]